MSWNSTKWNIYLSSFCYSKRNIDEIAKKAKKRKTQLKYNNCFPKYQFHISVFHVEHTNSALHGIDLQLRSLELNSELWKKKRSLIKINCMTKRKKIVKSPETIADYRYHISLPTEIYRPTQEGRKYRRYVFS